MLTQKSIRLRNLIKPPDISFITCVTDKDLYENFCLPTLPDGQEYIAVLGAKTMAEGYNRGIGQATAPIKCFIHQDATIYQPDLVSRLKFLFSNEEFGILGVIGATDDGNRYTMGYDLGRALIGREGKVLAGREVVFFEECNLLDGICLFTNQDIRFDERYDHFHFYDMDICKEIQNRGKKVICADITVRHCPDYKDTTDAWNRAREQFLSKHRL